MLYGINEDGEVLVLNSTNSYTDYIGHDIDLEERKIYTYAMRHQNLTGPNSEFIIVEKSE